MRHVRFAHGIHGSLLLALFATASLDIETETPGPVASDLSGGQPCEKIADLVEDAGVSGGIASWGAADGCLIHHDYFIESFMTDQLSVCAGAFLGSMIDTE